MASVFSRSVFLGSCTIVGSALALVGCGGGGTNPSFSGNTAITVMATSTANDQLFNFPIFIESFTLQRQDGTTVPLISSPTSEEFIHLNAKLEPLVSLPIPQGIYTSASLKAGSMDPACAGPYIFNGALQSAGLPIVTVNLPQPMQVTGSAMTMLLNLDVTQSGPYSGGCPANSFDVAFNPVFTLSAAPSKNSATSSAYGLIGVVASARGSQLSVNALNNMDGRNPPAWNFDLSSGTVVQGVSGASTLAPGMPVDLDAVLQPDGTLLATRVEVLDSVGTNLSAAYGSIREYSSSEPGDFWALETQFTGDLLTVGFDEYNFSGATFGVSKALSNIASLPFTASLTASNMVGGQNIFISSHQLPGSGIPPSIPSPLPVAQVTLLPQTVDGKVIDTGKVGAFTTYTIQLASYSLFPSVAAATPSQVAQLTSPNTIVVYADSSVRKMASSSVDVGVTYRFDGLIFNDNGTLRMDCDQISDGVAQ